MNKLAQKLRDMDVGSDQEVAQCEADEILLRRLEELGDVETAQAYRDARERIRFWYV